MLHEITAQSPTRDSPKPMANTKEENPPAEETPSGNSVAYTLFLYREQLRRRDARLLALSKTKLDLTQELVSFSVDRIQEYGVDELMNLNREIQFTRKLKSRMHQIRRMQKLYALQRNMQMKQ